MNPANAGPSKNEQAAQDDEQDERKVNDEDEVGEKAG